MPQRRKFIFTFNSTRFERLSERSLLKIYGQTTCKRGTARFRTPLAAQNCACPAKHPNDEDSSNRVMEPARALTDHRQYRLLNKCGLIERRRNDGNSGKRLHRKRNGDCLRIPETASA
jgi:hypothetical protein